MLLSNGKTSLEVIEKNYQTSQKNFLKFKYWQGQVSVTGTKNLIKKN